MIAELLKSYPELVAIAIAIVGIVAARWLARGSGIAIDSLESVLRRITPLRLERLDFSRVKPLARGLTYYASILFFLLLALQSLSITTVQVWLDALISYIPQLILTAVILLAGYLLGLVSRSLVASTMDTGHNQLMPRMAQILIMTAAILTGLSQLGINVTFITDVIVIVLATFIGGMALAFALGSQQLVANLLARRGLERYRIGTRIRIDGIEGEIIEVLDTAVVIESEEGMSTVPASLFAATDVLVFSDSDKHHDESGEPSNDQ